MHRCNHCATTWTGANRAHCSVCHRTFTVVSAFDRHRRDGVCLDPPSVGLSLSGALWGYPPSERNPWPVDSDSDSRASRTPQTDEQG